MQSGPLIACIQGGIGIAICFLYLSLASAQFIASWRQPKRHFGKLQRWFFVVLVPASAVMLITHAILLVAAKERVMIDVCEEISSILLRAFMIILTFRCHATAVLTELTAFPTSASAQHRQMVSDRVNSERHPSRIWISKFLFKPLIVASQALCSACPPPDECCDIEADPLWFAGFALNALNIVLPLSFVIARAATNVDRWCLLSYAFSCFFCIALIGHMAYSTLRLNRALAALREQAVVAAAATAMRRQQRAEDKASRRQKKQSRHQRHRSGSSSGAGGSVPKTTISAPFQLLPPLLPLPAPVATDSTPVAVHSLPVLASGIHPSLIHALAPSHSRSPSASIESTSASVEAASVTSDGTLTNTFTNTMTNTVTNTMTKSETPESAETRGITTALGAFARFLLAVASFALLQLVGMIWVSVLWFGSSSRWSQAYFRPSAHGDSVLFLSLFHVGFVCILLPLMWTPLVSTDSTAASRHKGKLRPRSSVGRSASMEESLKQPLLNSAVESYGSNGPAKKVMYSPLPPLDPTLSLHDPSSDDASRRSSLPVAHVVDVSAWAKPVVVKPANVNQGGLPPLLPLPASDSEPQSVESMLFASRSAFVLPMSLPGESFRPQVDEDTVPFAFGGGHLRLPVATVEGLAQSLLGDFRVITTIWEGIDDEIDSEDDELDDECDQPDAADSESDAAPPTSD